MTGGLLAVTLTVRLSVALRPPLSVTVNATMLLPREAEQLAATVAVTVPLVLVMPVTERPAGTLVAVTVRLPARSCASLTVAIVETVPAAPCWREMVAPLMAGGLLAV